jgi:hypothetical protein
MNRASLLSLLLVCAALPAAVACGDDDDDGAPASGVSGAEGGGVGGRAGAPAGAGGRAAGGSGMAGAGAPAGGSGVAGAGGDVGAGGEAGAGQGGAVPTVHGTPFCNDGGWCWANPTPQGLTLYSVHGSRDDDVWAVGDHGTVVHWDGQSWGQMPSVPTSGPLLAVWAFAPNEVWASGYGSDLGEGQTMWRWDGAAWHSTHVITHWPTNVMWASSPDDVWLGGYPGWLAHWDGESWRESPPPTPDTADVHQLWGTSADDLWAIIQVYPDEGNHYPYALARYDGFAWSRVSLPGGFEPQLVTGTSATDVIAIGMADERTPRPVMRWDGESWAPEGWVTADFGAPVAASATAVWLGGRGDGFSLRENGAWAIEPVANDDPENVGAFHSAWASPSGRVWAVGENGTIARRVDGAWKRDSKGNNAIAIASLWGRGDDDLWAASFNGRLRHWDGTRWTPSPPVEGWSELLDQAWLVGDSATGDAWLLGAYSEKSPFYDFARWDGSTWKKVASPDSSTYVGGRRGAFAVGGYLYGLKERPVCFPSCPEVSGLWRTDGTTFEDLPGCVDAPDDPYTSGAAIWAAGPDDLRVIYVTASGPSRSFLMTLSGGTCTYEPIPSLGTSGYYNALGGVAPDDLWAFGYGVAAHWDGAAWTTQPSDLYALDRVIALAPDDIWAGTYHYDGAQWAEKAAPFALTDVWASRTRALGAYGHHLFERLAAPGGATR